MITRKLLLAFTLFGCTTAQAADPETPGNPGGKKNELAGSVQHAQNKKPLKDVNVTAYLVTSRQKSVVTSDGGLYAFDELKPGTYKFVFEKAGFRRVTKERVVIKTDEPFQLNVEMIEIKDFDLAPSPLHFSDF